MAISTPTERYAQQRTAQGATTTFSPTGTIAAGSFVVLLTTTGVAGLKKISSVSDDAGGNTWAVDASGDNADQGDIRAWSAASLQVATQLTTGTTITINWSVVTNNSCSVWLQEVTGIATSSAFDQTADQTGGASTTWTTANTGTLAQADEIVFQVARGTNGSDGWTSTGGFSDLTTPTLGGLSGGGYKIVAATTAVAGSATVTNLSDYAMGVVTYKGLVVPSTANLAPVIYGRGAC